MATLSAIRSQARTLINETDSNNSHFSDAQLNEFINQAVKFMATLIEYPRTLWQEQVSEGDPDYDLPSDFVSAITCYFGSQSIQGDIRPLRIITEETLREFYPSWLETVSGSRGRPRFAFFKNRTTFTLVPTPDADSGVAGKKIHMNYVQVPATLSSDGSSPNLPVPFHDLLQFYVAHLAYLRLDNAELATEMMKNFSNKMKSIQAEVVKESKEALTWQWGFDPGVNLGDESGITFD